MLRTCLVFLCLILSAGPVTAGGGVAPVWPLDLPTRYLTSNFMEYRPGRFHAGLDLKTQTVCGFAARAVEDGWILRVRATPGAYGRAVYLRGASGRTYVYAHLSRFNDVLRARVVDRRARSGTYRTRLSFKPGEIAVRRGDVLGLTGQSGTGGPHLHFEVRDGNNRPLDPQAVGFAVADTMAPVIHRIRAWPVSLGTNIQGRAVEHILDPPDGIRGAQPTLRVTGPVAFSARIVDHADIRGHRLEPSLIEVWLDGARVYRCRNEGFAFAENAYERLEWVVLPGVREHWLHRDPADSLTGREGGLWYLGGSGKGLSSGSHEVRIVAADQAGNRTEAQFELVIAAGPGQDRVDAGTAWHPAPVSPVIASRDSLAFIRITPFFVEDSEAVRGDHPQLRRREYSVRSGDPVMAPLVVFSDAATLTAVQRTAAAEQGLDPVGQGREFWAATWPLTASLPVLMDAPEEPAAADWGLYRWHDTHWTWVAAWPGAVVQAGEVAVKLDRPGLYAVFADGSSPTIGNSDPLPEIGPGPASTVPGITLSYWSVLPVGLRDAGSGVAAASINVRLDGRKLIVEPDLPRDRILIEFPDGMAAGPHRIVIEASDRAGRTARRELSVQAVR